MKVIFLPENDRLRGKNPTLDRTILPPRIALTECAKFCEPKIHRLDEMMALMPSSSCAHPLDFPSKKNDELFGRCRDMAWFAWGTQSSFGVSNGDGSELVRRARLLIPWPLVQNLQQQKQDSLPSSMAGNDEATQLGKREQCEHTPDTVPAGSDDPSAEAFAYGTQTPLAKRIRCQSSTDAVNPTTLPSPLRHFVRFAEPVVFSVAEVYGAAEYDRTSVPVDQFQCDVCSIAIPAGIRGFEPYATCKKGASCPYGGFDACMRCVRIGAGKKGRWGKHRDKKLKVKGHRHRLIVVDPGAEVAWALESEILREGNN